MEMHKKQSGVVLEPQGCRYLVESFEFITAISESSDSIHVEGVFSLTDGGDPLLQSGDVDLLIGLLTVV